MLSFDKILGKKGPKLGLKGTQDVVSLPGRRGGMHTPPVNGVHPKVRKGSRSKKVKNKSAEAKPAKGKITKSYQNVERLRPTTVKGSGSGNAIFDRLTAARDGSMPGAGKLF